MAVNIEFPGSNVGGVGECRGVDRAADTRVQNDHVVGFGIVGELANVSSHAFVLRVARVGTNDEFAGRVCS